MINWRWTTKQETWFTGVVRISREPGALKHFYCGLDKTLCGLPVVEFLPADDALVTCPECRSHPGFFEAPAGEMDIFARR